MLAWGRNHPRSESSIQDISSLSTSLCSQGRRLWGRVGREGRGFCRYSAQCSKSSPTKANTEGSLTWDLSGPLRQLWGVKGGLCKSVECWQILALYLCLGRLTVNGEPGVCWTWSYWPLLTLCINSRYALLQQLETIWKHILSPSSPLLFFLNRQAPLKKPTEKDRSSRKSMCESLCR